MTPNTFRKDCESYQKAHGAAALCLYQGNGKLYIVRDQTAEHVVLAEVCGTDDLTVSAEEFSAYFLMVLLDESVLYAGTKTQQDVALTEHQAVFDAIQRVLYGDAKQLPATLPE